MVDAARWVGRSIIIRVHLRESGAVSQHPLLTFGVPVYNGERFVGAAIASLLAQTEPDIEVVVSDNASTDRTAAIVSEIAHRDRRVRLLRQATNLGLPKNFDAVVHEARGRYFAWVAADDSRLPEFARRCLDALEATPEAVLAYTRAESIDERGEVVRSAWGGPPETRSTDPCVRFRAALDRPRDPMPLALFAVIRTDVLRSTGLFVPVPGLDRALVAELSLHGPFIELPEVLFFQGEHAGRIGPAIAGDGREAMRRLGSTSRVPNWALLRRHIAALGRRPASVPARGVSREVVRWAWRERAALIADLVTVVGETGGRFPVIGGRVAALAATHPQRRWRRRVERLERTLIQVISEGERIVFVDDDSFEPLRIGPRSTMPLWLRDGESWGVPGSEAEIIEELIQRRAEGATHVAVAWTASWVLDLHGLVRAHLATVAREIHTDGELTIHEFRHPT